MVSNEAGKQSVPLLCIVMIDMVMKKDKNSTGEFKYKMI